MFVKDMDRKEDIIDMICRCGYFCELKFTLHFHRIKHIGYAQEKKYLFQVICTLGTEMFTPLADFST